MTQNSAIAIDINSLFNSAVVNEFKVAGVAMPLTFETLQPYSRHIQDALAQHDSLPDVLVDDLMVELAECLLDNWERCNEYGDELPDMDEFVLDVSRCVAAITR
jgi:hypothetical protein